MKYEWKNLFVLGANFFSSNIKLSLTINASFICIIRTCNYINETCVFIIKACNYRFLLDKSNFSIRRKELCNRKIITYLLIDESKAALESELRSLEENHEYKYKSFIPGFMLIKVNVSFTLNSFLLLNTIFAYHLYKKRIAL